MGCVQTHLNVSLGPLSLVLLSVARDEQEAHTICPGTPFSTLAAGGLREQHAPNQELSQITQLSHVRKEELVKEDC